ncbi:hypothetical protein SB659_06675 [Arthrobacter sp. SIMBA_036]|uniref:hypothetical protein n=1 Tax=Arthrobacter sp. SIMBA_036 TaxID=3085778 RepID=UPI00397E70DE
MQINPVLKPKVATPALIVASAVALALAIVLLPLTFTSPSSGWALPAFVAAGLVLLYLWFVRLRALRVWLRALRVWQAATNAQWSRLESLKHSGETTTEVTVLSVDSPQPTGAWITLRWNHFDYIQQAWIEALPEPIWPGLVLLIRPDPAEVRPGSPWPATYRLVADHVLAWAPQI